MKKMIGKLMVLCFLAMPVGVLAQSGDNMKNDQMQQDLIQLVM